MFNNSWNFVLPNDSRLFIFLKYCVFAYKIPVEFNYFRFDEFGNYNRNRGGRTNYLGIRPSSIQNY